MRCKTINEFESEVQSNNKSYINNFTTTFTPKEINHFK